MEDAIVINSSPSLSEEIVMISNQIKITTQADGRDLLIEYLTHLVRSVKSPAPTDKPDGKVITLSDHKPA